MIYNTNKAIPPIIIGRRGENEVESVYFDFSEWKVKYGTGTLILLIQRPNENVIYPVELTTEGIVATWTISSTDTAMRGIGKGTLQYTVSGKVKKTKIFKFIVDDALTANGTAPAPYNDYVNQVLSAASRAEEAAGRAVEYGQQIKYENNIIYIGGGDNQT